MRRLNRTGMLSILVMISFHFLTRTKLFKSKCIVQNVIEYDPLLEHTDKLQEETKKYSSRQKRSRHIPNNGCRF